MRVTASRAQGQLAQVIKELKDSSYRPRMAVIGSRAQRCVHKEVKSLTGTAQRAACKQKTSSRTCAHYNEVDRFQKAEPDYGKGVPVDIEDLTQLGEKGRIGGGCGPCPYYLSQVRIGIARFPNPGTYVCRLSARNYVIHAVRKTDTFRVTIKVYPSQNARRAERFGTSARLVRFVPVVLPAVPRCVPGARLRTGASQNVRRGD